ncbi:recombinase family protein [Paenibacillus sp. HJGM_3]|uniref:recombinase family protein n=1 Tax=Paenibacillus sp. HJGM_3 TaxID=3379816 RepID=UPI003859849E
MVANLSAPKRVACLYRVSTKGQLSLNDDIPDQRRACQNFINSKSDWVLVKEYVEKGVSAFKVSASKRDEIQRAKDDAEKGLFDVLLVFMFDRLGRRDDETPFVMKWFAKQGVELWSVNEGQQKFESHGDDLMNYIRFWQSSGESKKTSMRVKENHTQMVEDGKFRGGKPPYGYKLVKTSEVNKKGKELMGLAVNEEQAAIVREMYMLVYEQGFGSNRIAKYFNIERKPTVMSSTGGEWTTGVINFILRNPIYKGYSTYGKRTSDFGVFNMQPKDKWVLSQQANDELIIVDESVWNAVQTIRSSRTPDKSKNDSYERVTITKSPLLFTGIARCGHCGSPLTTTYNSKKYALADGTIQKWKSAKYRCSGKALGKSCDGQTIHSHNKIEGVVLEEVDKYLDKLKQVDYNKEIEHFRKKNLGEDTKLLKSLQKDIEEHYKELAHLHAEVPKAIASKSSFKPELLSSLIEHKYTEIKEVAEKIKQVESTLGTKKVEIGEMEALQKHIPIWKEEFEAAPHEKKKMMLNSIIERITVYRDSIVVDVKLHVSQFISSLMG